MNSSDYDLACSSRRHLKFRMCMSLIEASVVFAPGSCNKPAHELTALGVGIPHRDYIMWTTSYPSSITHLVTDDFTVF
jgi:hypothetical protein